MITVMQNGREVSVRRVTDYPWYDSMTPEQVAEAQAELDRYRARVAREVEFGREVGVPDEELEKYLEWFDGGDDASK